MPAEVARVNPATVTDESIARAARALHEGRLVIFPTETVYGVGANAADATAVTRLRTAKGRASEQPFTVHLGRRADARRYLSAPTPVMRRLARKAWPGPVTLVCEETDPARTEIGRSIPQSQLGEIFCNGLVGLRVPDHPAAMRLLSSVECPVVASAANRAGRPPPSDVTQALQDLDGDVDIALDGGKTRFNGASTIVEVRGNQWKVSRAGVVDERTIARMAVSEILFVCTGNSCRSPLAEHLFRTQLAARLNVPVARLAELGYVVTSAGSHTYAGGPMSSGSLQELVRRGMDAADHRSQPLSVELIQRAERIFAMSPDHVEAVLDLVPGAVQRVELLDPAGAITDPMGGGPDEYRIAAEHIEQALQLRLEAYLREDLDW